MLEETGDFLQLYCYHCGRSEIPPEFHLWCGIAVIAAAVADRVGYRKFPHKVLKPNLYTMIVAPSGSGKGEAIDVAESLLYPLDVAGRMNFYRGKITGAALIDHLSKRKNAKRSMSGAETSQIFLSMPELSMSIRGGGAADDLLKDLTDFYSGSLVPIMDRTREHGLKKVPRPCVNILMGTIQEWLVETIPRSHIHGGSLARIITIITEANYDHRMLVPWYPPDFVEVREYLQARLIAMSFLEGEFKMSEKAREIEEDWYYHRQPPANNLLAPFWEREHDMVLKLCMVLSLSEGNDLIIKNRHMARSIELVDEIASSRPRLIEFASVNPYNEHVIIVAEYVRKYGEIRRSRLLKKVQARGINAEKLSDAIRTLSQAGDVKIVQIDRATIYVWKARRTLKNKAKKED